MDKTIQLWHIADRDKPIYTFIGHTDTITAMDFSINGKLLASGSSDGRLIIWDLGKVIP